MRAGTSPLAGRGTHALGRTRFGGVGRPGERAWVCPRHPERLPTFANGRLFCASCERRLDDAIELPWPAAPQCRASAALRPAPSTQGWGVRSASGLPASRSCRAPRGDGPLRLAVVGLRGTRPVRRDRSAGRTPGRSRGYRRAQHARGRRHARPEAVARGLADRGGARGATPAPRAHPGDGRRSRPGAGC